MRVRGRGDASSVTTRETSDPCFPLSWTSDHQLVKSVDLSVISLIYQEMIQIMVYYQTLDLCTLITRYCEDGDGIKEYLGKFYGMKEHF